MLDFIFSLAGIFVAAILFIIAMLLKQGPGAKNMSKMIADRNIRGGVKVIFTQRIFGFGDFGLFDHKVSGREMVFFLIFVLVIIAAIFFF